MLRVTRDIFFTLGPIFSNSVITLGSAVCGDSSVRQPDISQGRVYLAPTAVGNSAGSLTPSSQQVYETVGVRALTRKPGKHMRDQKSNYLRVFCLQILKVEGKK